MRSQAKTAIAICALMLAQFASAGQLLLASEPNDLPATGPAPPPQLRFLDDKAKALLNRWAIPGCAVAICRDGQVMFARGYGYGDLDAAMPVDADKSLFRIASVSKPITAWAVLQLVDQGKLHLDDHILDLLPESAAWHLADKRLQLVTVRDLLNMTAGWDKELSGDPILQPYITRAARYMHRSGPADFDTTMRYVLSKRLDFTPGTRFAYSNFAYGLLGKIVEQASGQDYASFVRRTMFEPCAVQLYPAHTLLQDRLPNEVVYYAPLEPQVRPFLPCKQRRVPSPYARAYLESDLAMVGWLASASQLAQLFDKMLSDEKLLPSAQRQQIFNRPPVNSWQGKRRFFSMGWEVIKDARGQDYLYKDGTLPGTRAFAEHTASGITWVALFNARPAPQRPDKFARQLQELMARALNALPAGSEVQQP